MTPNLTVEAELVLEHDGRRFRVRNDGDRLVLDAPSLLALRDIEDLRERIPLADVPVGPGATAAGLTFEIRVRRATVARVGAGVSGNLPGKLVAGENTAVDLQGVATAAVRSLG